MKYSAGALGGLLVAGYLATRRLSPWTVRGCDPTAVDPPRIDTSAHYDTTWCGQVYRTDGATESNYDRSGGPLPRGPDELVVHVHGWRNDRDCGIERIEETTAAYAKAGYEHPATGLTWDSGYAWWNAKAIAKRNGPKLARFVTEYKAAYPNTAVRMQAHSLGVLVLAEALRVLDETDETGLVTSAVFLGGAIPATSVAKGGRYGTAIENVVEHVENFWMVDDKVLQRIFGILERDSPLGTEGCHGEPPRNYTDHELTGRLGHSDYYRSVRVIERVVELFVHP